MHTSCVAKAHQLTRTYKKCQGDIRNIIEIALITGADISKRFTELIKAIKGLWDPSHHGRVADWKPAQ